MSSSSCAAETIFHFWCGIDGGWPPFCFMLSLQHETSRLVNPFILFKTLRNHTLLSIHWKHRFFIRRDSAHEIWLSSSCCPIPDCNQPFGSFLFRIIRLATGLTSANADQFDIVLGSFHKSILVCTVIPSKQKYLNNTRVVYLYAQAAWFCGSSWNIGISPFLFNQEKRKIINFLFPFVALL